MTAASVKIKGGAAAVIVAFLVGCAPTIVPVPLQPVTVATSPATAKVSGRYAAYVQTGGWTVNTRVPFDGCDGFIFETEINTTYEEAAKAALSQSLESVTFVSNVLSPADLKQHGYEGQIVLYQGNAESKAHFKPGFLFKITPHSETELVTILAMIGEKGLAYQESILGKGTFEEEKMAYFFFSCKEEAPPPLTSSTEGAIRELAKGIASHARAGAQKLKSPSLNMGLIAQ